MKDSTQLTTFSIGHDLYGIEVSFVQEVTGNLPIISVPLAPPFVQGLINLRGQIATAIGLRQLFKMSAGEEGRAAMSVVCRFDGNLVSLLVDSIGDVMEVPNSKFEAPPKTVPDSVRRFLKGVYKIDGALLSVIDVSQISQEIANVDSKIEAKVI